MEKEKSEEWDMKNSLVGLFLAILLAMISVIVWASLEQGVPGRSRALAGPLVPGHASGRLSGVSDLLRLGGLQGKDPLLADLVVVPRHGAGEHGRRLLCSPAIGKNALR
jgi:hypothetical protein